jgi:hypothetical protein
MLQPCDADPLAEPQTHHAVAQFVHSADNLMARDNRHLVSRQVTLHNVKIRAANSADAYFHPNLAGAGSGLVHFSFNQWRLLHAVLLRQDHGTHGHNISGKSGVQEFRIQKSEYRSQNKEPEPQTPNPEREFTTEAQRTKGKRRKKS